MPGRICREASRFVIFPPTGGKRGHQPTALRRHGPGPTIRLPGAARIRRPRGEPLKTTRRDFLRAGGMLSMSSLMGTAALMTQSDNANAATEWAEHFQKNYRLMTPEEKNEARLRLERRYSDEYGKKVASTPPRPSPAC
jgi:hypothetical protein